METAPEITGPLVEVCDSPACRGALACDQSPAAPVMALTEWLEPGRYPDEFIAEFFVQELILCCASDSAGIRHVIPDGMKFTVHKGSGGLAPEWAAAHPGRIACTAVYGGSARDRDEILATAPVADPADGSMERRWLRAREAGRFRVLEEYGT